MRYKNGFFQIVHKDGGTFVKLFPPVEGGEKIDINDILYYLKRIKIDINVTSLSKAIEEMGDTPVEHLLVNEERLPENECMELTVSPDKTKAIVRFYPPSSKGKLMTREDILGELEHHGIRFGVIERNIDIYLKARQFCTDFVIAKAKKPIQGRDAVITYHFEVDKKSVPKINEDGSVDFHRVDNMNHIEAGALLATLKPAVKGKPGTDIYGKDIKPRKVIVKKLQHGNNIHLSESGLKMYSDVDGHVQLTGEKVFVSNTYEVPADVGTSTGDVSYEGNVHVKGNVITGFKIEAKGDIIVDGVVEGATLIAGGQIVLKRGIQGMNRGVLRSEMDIVTKFIENSEVFAGGDVKTDAIMHSDVSAKGDVISTGKRGLIIGGNIHSEGNISMKEAGSEMGTKTILEIGMDPALLEEYQSLEKQIDSMNEEIEKFSKTIGMYGSKIKKGEKLPEDRLKAYQVAKKSVEILRENIENAKERTDELREEMERHNQGKITISQDAYPGVKVTINNANYFVKKKMSRVKFVKDKAAIKVMTA